MERLGPSWVVWYVKQCPSSVLQQVEKLCHASAEKPMELALIRAPLILSRRHLCIALHRLYHSTQVLKKPIRSRSTASELLVSLAPFRHIGEALKQFGVDLESGTAASPLTDSGATAGALVEDVVIALHEAPSTTLIAVSQLLPPSCVFPLHALGQSADKAAVAALYAIPAKPDAPDDWLEGVVCGKLATADL